MIRRRVPPMLAALVQTGILSVDGHLFSRRESCPECGGEVAGYDTRERRFAVVAEDPGEREINVLVKRYSCRQCGRISFADAPFYPDTRYGSPVVDLCIVLSENSTPGKTAAIMRELGLVVERSTIRNYRMREFPPIPTTEIYGLRIPASVISLSMLGAGVR
ncbi:MAG: hypothetical protein LUQ01_05485 [Methanolinea sp.]|nr:hypothetical protein [Methanolinea sp.]